MLWQFSSLKVQRKHILCYILHHILDFRLLFRFMTLFAYLLVALQGLNHSCPCLYTVSCLVAWHHEWKQLGSNSTVGSPPCARHRARHLTSACSGGPTEWLYACVFWPIPLPVAEESTAVKILGFYVRKWITGKPTIKAEMWKLHVWSSNSCCNKKILSEGHSKWYYALLAALLCASPAVLLNKVWRLSLHSYWHWSVHRMLIHFNAVTWLR